uniref:Cyclic nucleotide-binding domain-containing protein n=1 Tax=Haptolina brevifila TaxID=156173 RepID=A0A7S2NIC8_9EUKA
MADVISSAGGQLRLAEPPPHVARAIYRVARGRLHDTASFQDTLRTCEDSLIEALARPAPPSIPANPSTDVQAVMLFLRPGQLEREQSLRIEGLATSLLSLAPQRSIAPEEVVWRPEDQASSFLIVLSGSLELMYDGVHVERLVPGSSCGFLFMFAHGRRDTLMMGSSASTVLVISRSLFEAVHSSHPSLETQIREGMMARVAIEYQHYVRHHVVTHRSPQADRRMQWGH